MNSYIEKTIGEIVAQDYRTAAVFEQFGIDFCCKGNRTIQDACAAKNISSDAVIQQLTALPPANLVIEEDYKQWPMDKLTNHIEERHHGYVNEKMPLLLQYLEKVSKVHGREHPEVVDIYELFRECAAELSMHMKKEELILFPFIRKMAGSNKLTEMPHFGTVENPVNMMRHEHDTEGERFRKIAVLSNDYTPPADACNTYRVSYAMLKEFEQDLHLHIHLENNILFPAAIQREKELMELV
jgi:regulator of cell morphogenesis and NO signaling